MNQNHPIINKLDDIIDALDRVGEAIRTLQPTRQCGCTPYLKCPTHEYFDKQQRDNVTRISPHHPSNRKNTR